MFLSLMGAFLLPLGLLWPPPAGTSHAETSGTRGDSPEGGVSVEPQHLRAPGRAPQTPGALPQPLILTKAADREPVFPAPFFLPHPPIFNLKNLPKWLRHLILPPVGEEEFGRSTRVPQKLQCGTVIPLLGIYPRHGEHRSTQSLLC